MPAPTADTLYMVHFPPGVSIDLDGSGSCVVFCAYHNTFVHNGVNVYYGVMPDQGGSCAGGCGTDPSLFNNLTSVSSHELIEAVTDAAVGLATTVGPPLAWYDQTNGEIGDICNAQQGSIAGYTVQAEWSNKASACIVTAGSPARRAAPARCAATTAAAARAARARRGRACDSTGQCQQGCTPQCTGKQCGDDGCGGSCGVVRDRPDLQHRRPVPGRGHCAHADCDTGSALANGCDACVTQICARRLVLLHDGVGLDLRRRGRLGLRASRAPRSARTTSASTGGTLTSGCDACVTQICATDSYCCNTAWDRLCVNEVGTVCGKSCGGGSTCAHPICSTGSQLASGCDPCATKICASDSYCCSTAWDSVCVSEVGSICGQSCP